MGPMRLTPVHRASPVSVLVDSARILGVAVTVALVTVEAARGPGAVIAHRGASDYAPEHSRAAYELAITQGASFVEQDLAVSKDGVLVCLHDDTLQRTSNVADVFPDRFTREALIKAPGRHWIANDFTLDELRRLDVGRWFDAKFSGQRILTFQEAIDLVKGKAGLYPELKSPPLYTGRGIDMVKLFVDVVRKNGLDTAASLATTPMIVQSFDEPTVRRLAKELPTVPRVFLLSRFPAGGLTEARLKEIATFATGIGPDKTLIANQRDVVAKAHGAGLTVTAYTFSARSLEGYTSVRAEMSHFLDTLGVDAVFTNSPDQFPK